MRLPDVRVTVRARTERHVALDRDKYRRLFVDEAREGLSAIANELVELERAAKSGDLVPEASKARFDVVFRHAHSMKGMGAAMGYARFANLAHRLEDLADLGRQGRALPAEAWDLLLQGCDVLESCVDAVAGGSDDPDPGDLHERVAAFLARARGDAPAPSAAQGTETPRVATTPETTPTTPTPTASTAASGTVAVRVRIADDATLPQVRAFVVHKTLSAMPGWVETTPSPELLRQKELPEFTANRTLTFRFAAGVDLAAVTAAAKGAQGVGAVDVVQANAEKEKDDKPGAAAKAAGDDERTVRVKTALLDDLIDSVGEVLLTRSRLRALSARLDHPELSELVDEVDRLTRELHGRVVAARMTPLSFMAERFPRAVRDLARQQGKSVDFTMSGMDIELDRAILDELQAPLIHMLRNAVDHAHEGDEVRARKGRLRTMKLALRAVRDRDRVLLELVDDGKGIDGEAVKKKALEKGLIDKARADALSAEAALDLVCLPGLSTAEKVTETSGRGVGMDVVKATLEKLGGALRIHSRRDHGTTMTMQLPLTVAIIQVLVVDAGAPDGDARDGYVIPVARVDRALAVDDGAVTTTTGRSFLSVGDRLVPLFDLGELLGLCRSDATRGRIPPGGTAILVGAGRGEIALRVERIVGQEEVVAKPLGPPLSAFPFVAGGAVLADGRAAYILEPARLVADDAAGGRVE